MSSQAEERAPTWLFSAIARSKPRTRVEFFDRPGPPSRLDSEQLRQFGTSSLGAPDERTGAIVGVVARPWGCSRALRTNPDHPQNRADLQLLASRWNRPYQVQPYKSGLWFVPGWVLDTWVRPQFVSLPSFESLAVHIAHGYTGPTFAARLATHAHRPVGGSEMLPLEQRMVVMDIAGPSHAPGLVHAGTVLDARMYLRPVIGRQPVLGSEETSSLRARYLGTVIERVPTHTGRVLPGEPLEDVRERWVPDMRKSMSWIEEMDELTEHRSSAPRLIGD